MKPEEVKNKKILFSPLNWGMGHVSRSISLLKQLTDQGNEVIIACDDDQKVIFQEYLDNVTYAFHEGYPFEFKGKGKFGLDLIIGYPDLQMRLDKEKREVTDYCQKNKIDLVLSDHRYGFRSENIHSVFITHQTDLPTKWYQFGVNTLHHRWMNKFDEIWIMDYPDHKLSGKLSNYEGEKTIEYIGPFSRFSSYSDKVEKDIDVVLIASGPDVYAQQLIDRITSENKVSTVICSARLNVPERVTRVSGSWKEQDAIIRRAKKIVSRSGYTTVMDLEFLDAEYDLIPTPGQEEQIYLAKKMER